MSQADRTELQDVMLRYAAGVDERDMALYRSCFADDVEVVGFTETVMKGAEQWVTFVTQALTAYGATQHMLGPQLAQIDGDKAVTRNDVQAFHELLEPPGATLILWATYKTDMHRTRDGWKITRHELVKRATRIDGA